MTECTLWALYLLTDENNVQSVTVLDEDTGDSVCGCLMDAVAAYGETRLVDLSESDTEPNKDGGITVYLCPREDPRERERFQERAYHY